MKLAYVVVLLAACGASKAADPSATVGNTAAPPTVDAAPPPELAACAWIEGVMMDSTRKEPMFESTVVAVGGPAPNEDITITDGNGAWKLEGRGRTQLIVYYEDKVATVDIDPTRCKLGTLWPVMKTQ